MNKNEIRNLLVAHGLTGVVSTRGLAAVLGLSGRTVAAARIRGDLKQIDRNTYSLDGVVAWLFAHQRYLVRISGGGLK